MTGDPPLRSWLACRTTYSSATKLNQCKPLRQAQNERVGGCPDAEGLKLRPVPGFQLALK